MSARYRTSGFLAVLAGGASLMAIASTQPAMAQSDQPSASSGGLEEVVVTARRKEEKAQSVPIALTTFNQSSIETQEVHAIADLDKDTPGIAVCCNRDSVYQIWVRGVPGAVGYFDDVPLINFNGYSLFFDTGSFQVLKGPQGTLFGQSADGGALLYESKMPVNDFEGSVEGAVGDYGHRESQIILNVPIVDDKLLLRVGGVYSHTDGYVKDLTTGVETGSENYWIARATVTWRPTDDIQNDTLINYYTSNNTGSAATLNTAVNPKGLFPLLYGANAVANIQGLQAKLGRYAFIGGTPRGAEFTSTENYTIINTTRYDINDNLSVKNILGYQEVAQGTSNGTYNFAIPYNIYPLSAGALAALLSHPLVPPGVQVLYTEELQFQGKIFDDKLSYTFGTFNDFGGTRQPSAPNYLAGLGGSVTASESWGSQRTNAVYGQGTYDLSDFVSGLSFTGGYRYTWDKQTLTTWTYSQAGTLAAQIAQLGNFKAPSYTLSLDYQVTPDTLLYITDAKGYSKGGFNGGNAAAATGISTFLPESLNNIEVGIKTDQDFSGIKARFNLSGFYGMYDNVQSNNGRLVPSPIPGVAPSLVVITTNAATAHIEGFDGSVTIIPTDDITLHADAGYLKTKYDTWVALNPQTNTVQDLTGTNFIYAPKWKYNGTVTYKLPIDESMGDLSFSATYSYTSFQHSLLVLLDNLTDDVPAHDNLDMSLNWRNVMGTNGLDARAYVTNVLENVWTDGSCLCWDSSSLGLANRSVAVPREWGMSVRYSFGPNNMGSHTAEAAYTPPPVVAPKMAPAPHSYLVFFDFDKSDLTPQAVQIVDQAAKNAGPSHVTRIDVTGHTDTVGSDAYNLRLSKRRAESVAAELEHQGVPASEISIIAKGKHDLLVPTADGVREPQNRRVEIVYEGGMGAGS